MADGTIRTKEGILVKIHDNGDGTFLFTTHDMGGGLLATDKPLEIQGYLLQMHDNGDGTFSVITTSTQAAADVTLEHEGFRIRLHATGQTDPLTLKPMYAVVTFGV